VCGVPKASINGNGAYTQGTAVYNPNKHMGHVLIRICSDCGFSETQLRLLIKHEYGHAIGLNHSGDYYSVMHTPVRYDINRHDSDAIRARYNGHGEG
jgi:predicted Zn-dependent protease